MKSLTSIEVYILPGFCRASFKELKRKVWFLTRGKGDFRTTICKGDFRTTICKGDLELQFARLEYRKLFVNFELCNFLNVSNLLKCLHNILHEV